MVGKNKGLGFFNLNPFFYFLNKAQKLEQIRNKSSHKDWGFGGYVGTTFPPKPHSFFLLTFVLSETFLSSENFNFPTEYDIMYI